MNQLSENHQEAISSDIQHKNALLHQEKMNIVVEEAEMNLIAKLGLKPQKDGNQFSFLYGDNLQEGIAGFGKTVYKAMLDFNKNFYREKAK